MSVAALFPSILISIFASGTICLISLRFPCLEMFISSLTWRTSYGQYNDFGLPKAATWR
jgi:hypothetical protein